MATCEMCGSIANQTTTIKVAGTNMQACGKCKHMGTPVEMDAKQNHSHTFRKKKKTNTKEEVIPNYSSVLNSSAAKKGLNIHQIAKSLNIKESTLTQYFSGKIKPDIQTAKTLERFLETSITEELEETKPQDYIEEDHQENSGLSLGDMLLKKMKKE